jgi:hypothetical protein
MIYSRCRHLAIERAKPAPTDTQSAGIKPFMAAHPSALMQDVLRLSPVLQMRMKS